MTTSKSTSQIKKLELQIKELDLQHKRALADYQNLEKRTQADRLHTIKYANQSLLDKLLPVLDNLELALNHIEDHGLNMIYDQLLKTLESEGLSEISAQGSTFDPQTMDCVEVVPGKKNQVIKIITKGYLYQDQVLRPARVHVGSGSNK